MNRQCPDCRVELTEINLVIQTGDGGEGWVAYQIGEPVQKRGFLGVKMAQSETHGRVAAMACPRCTRVLLFAVPSAD